MVWGTKSTVVVVWVFVMSWGVMGCSARVEPDAKAGATNTAEQFKIYDWRQLLLGSCDEPLDEITWIAAENLPFHAVPTPGSLTPQDRMAQSKARIYQLLGKEPGDATSKTPAVQMFNGHYLVTSDAAGHARVRGYQQACLDERRRIRVDHRVISIPATQVSAFESLCASLQKKGLYSAEAQAKMLAAAPKSPIWQNAAYLSAGIGPPSVWMDGDGQTRHTISHYSINERPDAVVTLRRPDGEKVKWLAPDPTHGAAAIEDKLIRPSEYWKARVRTTFRRFRLIRAGDQPIYSLSTFCETDTLPAGQWSMRRAKTTYWQATGVKPETLSHGRKGHRVQTQQLTRKQVEKRIGKPLASPSVDFVMTRAEVLPLDSPTETPAWLAAYPDEFKVVASEEISAGTYPLKGRRITLRMVCYAVGAHDTFLHIYDRGGGYVEVVRPTGKDTHEILRIVVIDLLKGEEGTNLVIRRGDVLHFHPG